ncbi:MAG: rhomboid family intramembrane serine protease [Bacteroidia bacterium]
MHFPITYFIIGITALVSFSAMNNPDLKNKLMFNAYAIKHRKEWWRLFTHALIHADFIHLLFNMITLYSIGLIVEQLFQAVFEDKGTLFYILLYVGGIFMSSVYSYEKHKDDMYYNALGASGAVSSVMFAFVLIAPMAVLTVMVLPMWAWLFGVLFLVASWYLGKRGGGNIGHDAHFWGAVYGVVFTLCLKPSLGKDFIDQIMNRFFH